MIQLDPPEIPVITCFPLETSGTVSKSGFTISSVGLILATVRAIPANDRKAPDTMPYAVLKA